MLCSVFGHQGQWDLSGDILAIGRPIGNRCQVASQRRSEAAR